MKLPGAVAIGPYRYTVERRDEIRSDQGDELWGQIRYGRELILIDRDASDNRARETFFHEVLHGIAQAVGARLKERDVQALSVGIVDFLLRNPDAARLFVESEETQ